MINLNTTDLRNMSKEELINITKQELQEYKDSRIYNQLSNNIPRIKNLDALEKRLQAYSLGDSEVLNLRVEVKDLLHQDVYKKTESPKATTQYSSYEEYLNARLRSK